MATNLRLKNAEIVLDNEQKVFQMGDRVRGKLVVNFTGDLPLSALQIGIVCMSKVRQADDSFDQKKLFEAFYELPKKVTSQVLRTGIHEIPFRFPLPDSSESPPSFSGSWGVVNHFVESKIFGDDLHRTGLEIKLENPVRSNLLLSVSGTSDKDLGLFCFGSGNVTMEAGISRKGHLPGESIPLKTLINNATTLKVRPRGTLYQTQIYSTPSGHRTLEVALGDPQHGNEIDAGDVAEELIEIPVPIQAPLTMKSTVVTVKYFLHVTLDIPHNIDLHINLPVVVTNKYALNDALHSEPEFAESGSNTPKESAGSRRKKRMSSKTNSTTSSNADTE